MRMVENAQIIMQKRCSRRMRITKSLPKKNTTVGCPGVEDSAIHGSRARCGTSVPQRSERGGKNRWTQAPGNGSGRGTGRRGALGRRLGPKAVGRAPWARGTSRSTEREERATIRQATGRPPPEDQAVAHGWEERCGPCVPTWSGCNRQPPEDFEWLVLAGLEESAELEYMAANLWSKKNTDPRGR